MSHQQLVEQTKAFLSKKLHVNPAEFHEDDEVIKARIEESAALMSGMPSWIPNGDIPAIPMIAQVKSELNKFAQGKSAESPSVTLYKGKSNNNGIFYIDQDKNGYTIKKEGAKGAKVTVSSFTTFDSALYMLQSQVPSIIALENKRQLFQDVSKEDVTPVDVISFDSLKESCDDWVKIHKTYGENKTAADALKRMQAAGWSAKDASKELKSRGITETNQMNEAVIHILSKIGVSNLNMLEESKKEELIRLASDVHPYIND